ncbi:MAG TPA: hypothetical protein VD772_02455, partial [Anseongella sp.]|nr:hypothetical protein [Anseongella sp.]
MKGYTRRAFIAAASAGSLVTALPAGGTVFPGTRTAFPETGKAPGFRRAALGGTSLRAPGPETGPATWIALNNKVYGAKPDERGPVGGGDAYADILSKGDYIAEDMDSLLGALSKARAGQVIFLPGETEIDLTTCIYIEQLVLEVPGGVTLAGNRGYHGSRGALLASDALNTPLMIRAAGPDVRITGLRLQGPNPKRHMEHHRRAFGPGGLGHEY